MELFQNRGMSSLAQGGGEGASGVNLISPPNQWCIPAHFGTQNEYVNDCLSFHSLLAGEGMVSEPAEAAPALNRETYAATRAQHTGYAAGP